MRVFNRLRRPPYQRGRRINPANRHTRVQIGILLAVVMLCAVVVVHSIRTQF